MHLDKNILQSKTVCNIMKVLEEAETITKTGTNDCQRINKDIRMIVKAHKKALNKKQSILNKIKNRDIVTDYVPTHKKRHYVLSWNK